jgi:hypothetical protein
MNYIFSKLKIYSSEMNERTEEDGNLEPEGGVRYKTGHIYNIYIKFIAFWNKMNSISARSGHGKLVNLAFQDLQYTERERERERE